MLSMVLLTVKEKNNGTIIQAIGDEVIEFTAKDYAQQKADETIAIAKKAAEEAKIVAKKAAQEKLTALGLTIEELKALGL
jgi:hypothetical protein